MNSQQWPISGAEADARELTARRADAGRGPPRKCDRASAADHLRDGAVGSGAGYNVDARGAVAFIEDEDAVGLVCWLFEKELLAKISAGFREIGDDKNALNARQRAEMLATIDADSLAAERAECSLV